MEVGVEQQGLRAVLARKGIPDLAVRDMMPEAEATLLTSKKNARGPGHFTHLQINACSAALWVASPGGGGC